MIGNLFPMYELILDGLGDGVKKPHPEAVNQAWQSDLTASLNTKPAVSQMVLSSNHLSKTNVCEFYSQPVVRLRHRPGKQLPRP